VRFIYRRSEHQIMSPRLQVIPQPAGERLPALDGDVITKPKARQRAVVELIRSARRSLLLSIFRCDDLLILHELAMAAARGVRVEVLVTGRAKGWSQRLGPMAGCLERMGIEVHRLPIGGMKYHAKYMVADEQTAFIGTANLTRKSFRQTRDFILVTSERKAVQGLVELFRGDSAGTGSSACESLIVGPQGCRASIEQLLGSARSSIRILDHKLSDRRILAILAERERKGVRVEVYRGSAADPLKPHGRLIIVDRQTAVFGSFSLSEASLDGRRELGVAVRRAALVEKLERQFEKAAASKSIVTAAVA
jgi:cardiolipin synthase A/B